MPKIMVIGSMNMDLVIRTPYIPPNGETVLGNGFMTVPGGKGANQAVAASRLGGTVKMGGCVGRDGFGDELLENLRKNGVDTEWVLRDEAAPTGVAVILVQDGDNRIVVDPGANFRLSTEHIRGMESAIAESDILLLQLEIPLESVEEAVRIANIHGVPVILNPAPAREIPAELYRKIAVLTPNESECRMLSGMAADTAEDAKSAGQKLLELGAERVVVTLGGNGSVFGDRGGFTHMPGLKVPVVDTTAAGDSFSGALAVALAEGKSLAQAVEMATLVGSKTVQKAGAQPSLPYRNEISREISGEFQ